MIKHRGLGRKSVRARCVYSAEGIAERTLVSDSRRPQRANDARLTLGTLNTGSATLFVIILVHAISSSTLLLPLRRLLQVDLLLEHLAGDLVQLPSGRQGLLESGELIGGEGVGELDVELDVKVTVVVVTMRGHTLTLDDLDVTYGKTGELRYQ